MDGWTKYVSCVNRRLCPPVYTVHRRDNTYSLAVSNTGDGLEYHPTEADPLFDGFRAMHTIQLDDIEPGAGVVVVALSHSLRNVLYSKGLSNSFTPFTHHDQALTRQSSFIVHHQ